MPVIRLGLGRAWYGTDAIDIGRVESRWRRGYRRGGGGGRAEGEDVAGIGLVVVVFFVDGVVVGVLWLAVEVAGSARSACGGAGRGGPACAGRRAEGHGGRRRRMEWWEERLRGPRHLADFAPGTSVVPELPLWACRIDMTMIQPV